MAAKKTPCNSCGALRDPRSKTGLCRACHEEASKPEDPRISKAYELARRGKARIEIAYELGVSEDELARGELAKAVERGEAGIESLVLERLLDKAGSSTTAASEKLLLEVAGRIGSARRQRESDIPEVVTFRVLEDDEDDAQFLERLQRSHGQLCQELEAARLEIADLRQRLGIKEAEEEVEPEDPGIAWVGDFPVIDPSYLAASDEEQREIYKRHRTSMSEWAERQVSKMEMLPPEPRREDHSPAKYQRLMSAYRALLSAWAARP